MSLASDPIAPLARWRGTLVPGGQYDLTPLPDAARGFALTGLHAPERGPALILTANTRAAEALAADLEAWGAPFLLLAAEESVLPTDDHDSESADAESTPARRADPEAAAELQSALRALVQGWSGLVVATPAALRQPVPAPEQLRAADTSLRITAGHDYSRDAVLEKLIAAGYTREAQVEGRGQFAVRGAIVDIFGWDAAAPLRLEWDGENVASIRRFNPVDQRSVAAETEAVITLLALSDFSSEKDKFQALLRDYLPSGAIVFWLCPQQIALENFLPAPPPPVHAEALPRDLDAAPQPLPGLEFWPQDFLGNAVASLDPALRENRLALVTGRLLDWRAKNWRVLLACHNEGEAARLRELLGEHGIDPERTGLEFIFKPLRAGFVWPGGKLAVLADAEIFGRYQSPSGRRKQERLATLRARSRSAGAEGLEPGELAVHWHHGIARFEGVQEVPDGEGGATEALVLEFAEGAKLYVPLEQAFLVGRYVGVGKAKPKLDRLGGTRWDRARRAAGKAALDYAARILQLQAEREALPGFAFGPDTAWQREFETAFLHTPTPDQTRAIEEIKGDMESSQPMDRLLCGDVGFGKTEVALRAAFKAVMAGKQVAFLVPTTVLAEQHYRTLCERMADYPVKIALISRLRSPAEERAALAGARDGSVDILIGTHRLLSRDVIFKDLGLVIIDEEQRFGVDQKERLKDRFRQVDVLSLSATPIPRTLYLSLVGARAMSNLETPPANRVSVETIVTGYDERVIRDAIRRELARGGQVYFLHNRIATLDRLRGRIAALVPEARVVIGHGQMHEDELEEVMAQFVGGRADVLIATTIIESGLDIPNANTILIDRADRFGLADLYQLRGRVGRSDRKAHAYLFLPRDWVTSDARRRVTALGEYAQLGAGFQIAMRDLEIRGAGSLLGTAQSGHIAAVGFDLYCQLLKAAVGQLKTGKRPPLLLDAQCRLELDFLAWHESVAPSALVEKSNQPVFSSPLEEDEDATAIPHEAAYLPASYIATPGARMEAYRQLAQAMTEEELAALRADWRDRLGPWPAPVELLLAAQAIRIAAARARVARVQTEGTKLMLERGGQWVLLGGKFPRLSRRSAFDRLTEISTYLQTLIK